MKNIPKHIAIIMDGNGRWAKKRGLARIRGHSEGAKAVKRAVTYSRKIGIKFLTLFAFSTENWKRSGREIKFLFSMLIKYLDKEKNSLIKQNIRLRAIGDLEGLPGNVLSKLKGAIEETSSGNAMTLVVAVNYGSRDEIKRAVKKIVEKNAPGAEASEIFEGALDTNFMPDPDLLIRTSGEMRLSNFLLYQSAYSELYFTKTLWPDFGPRELRRAIDAYRERKRRFGGY